jgi:hypothetical protein
VKVVATSTSPGTTSVTKSARYMLATQLQACLVAQIHDSRGQARAALMPCRSSPTSTRGFPTAS